ncbi:MAG: DUF1302 family protein [Pseudomonadota bacterium]
MHAIRQGAAGSVIVFAIMGWRAASADIDASLAAEINLGFGDTRGQNVQQTIELIPSIAADLGPNREAVVSLRLRLDPANTIEAGEAPTANFGSGSQPAVLGELGTLEVRDAYIEQRWQRGLVRLGKQQIVWGRLDGLKVLDVVNPMDFREFVLDDFADSRLSLWSLYADMTTGPWRTELALIPDASGHTIPAADSWFNLAAPRFRFGAAPGSQAPNAVTSRRSGAGAGLRLSRRVKSLDIAALAYTGLDHEPLGRLSVRGNIPMLEQYYERREVYGISIEGAAGPLAYRAEVSVQPDRIFNVAGAGTLAAESLDQVVAGIGFDVDGPWNTFINVQHLQDRVRQAPSDLVRPATDRVSTVFVRRQFAYETLGVTARWYYSHELGDQMAALTVNYALSDATRFTIDINRFRGDRTGLFGQFADRDRITLRIAHTF